MEIQVKIHRLFNNECSNILGIASIILDGVIAIHGIKIMENMHGGKYYDIVHPVTAEFRCQLNDAIMQEYRKLLSKHQSQAATAGEPLPEQIAIEENNIPHQAQERTLFDNY